MKKQMKQVRKEAPWLFKGSSNTPTARGGGGGGENGDTGATDDARYVE